MRPGAWQLAEEGLALLGTVQALEPAPNQGDINMRAVQLTAYGNPVEDLKYVEIPAPDAPGPNQVLIGVEFSPINPSDLLLAKGIYSLRPALPTNRQ